MRGFVFFFVVLSGCASTTHLEESVRLQKAGQYEQAMVELEKASEASIRRICFLGQRLAQNC
jgi:uncharacterized protein YceK